VPYTVKIPGPEYWDPEKEEFINDKGWTFTIEHSLVSLRKWEAKYKKPFLTKEPKNYEELVDYIRFMTVTQNVNPEAYKHLTKKQFDEIQKYIDDPMTATWFSGEKKGGLRGSVVTAEIIYFWMIAQNIPFECQKWHLNQLLTLIKVCNAKNSKPQKMGTKEMLSQRAALNAARRKRLGSRG
jgi:hypothetical protein